MTIETDSLPLDAGPLTSREMKIAREAARMAVKEITDGFYAEVGRTFVQRALIWVGVAVVAFAAGKGWIIK